jgi:predicted HicB family RNase H-like nuclease
MATKKKSKVAPDPSRYTYRISWSRDEESYVATVAEFPSLSWISQSRETALRGLTSVIEEVLRDMVKNGEEIPAPWNERHFSGRFNLRLGSELHKKIALQAAERQESLNSYVVKKLGEITA